MSPKDLKIPELRHPEKARRPDNPQPKKPDWIRVKAPTSTGYKQTRDIMREHKLVTVCEEAGCPNVGECWSQGHATMMIMGEVCTRACTFCNIATGKPPEALDVFEPGRVADAVAKLGLNHVVGIVTVVVVEVDVLVGVVVTVLDAELHQDHLPDRDPAGRAIRRVGARSPRRFVPIFCECGPNSSSSRGQNAGQASAR